MHQYMKTHEDVKSCIPKLNKLKGLTGTSEAKLRDIFAKNIQRL